MALEPTNSQRAAQFKGLITNADPRDLGVSAGVVQSNIQCTRDGALDVRGGVRPGTFTNGTTAAAGQVMSVFNYRAAVTDWVIWQQNDGTVRVGKGFA